LFKTSTIFIIMFMALNYSAKNNLKNEYRLSKDKLTEITKRGIKLIAADYDGTLYDRYDPIYNDINKVVELAYLVTKNKIHFAFVSGRNTTLEIELREIIHQFCRKKKINLTIWRSGGNGMNLSKITYTSQPHDINIQKIYSNNINIEMAKIIIKTYEDLNIKADPKSQAFFKKFLEKNLPEDLVPKSFLKLAQPYQGKVFAESVKVSLVLPTNPKEQERYIMLLRKKLSKYNSIYKLNVGWGKIPFADVSKKLEYKGKQIDGKLLMVKNIIKELKIDESQVATFGDAPNDNNRGLLSLPYSFTNDKNAVKLSLNSSPYILKVKKSPVGAIYDAINYLV